MSQVRTIVPNTETFRQARSILLGLFPDANEATSGLQGIDGTKRFNGAILRAAQEEGLLSVENEPFFIDTLRDVVLGPLVAARNLQNGKPFIPSLREIAEEEPGEELKQMLSNYAGLKRSANKNSTDRELSEKIARLRNEILGAAKNSPATFFLHFFDNGDYKWLWGISEEDEFGGSGGVSAKSMSLRSGDSNDAEW